MNIDAWKRLKDRIGMPPVYVIEYTEKGSAKVSESLTAIVLYGTAVMPVFNSDDMRMRTRFGFREWSEHVRETYGV